MTTGPTGITGATGPTAGPTSMPMLTFIVRSRKTGPIVDGAVTATTREEAIEQCLARASEGETIEIMDVQEVPAERLGEYPGVTGVTGVTGTATTSRLNRAQLNEMTKEELLEEADRVGAEVSASWTKAEIIDAIVKHK